MSYVGGIEACKANEIFPRASPWDPCDIESADPFRWRTSWLQTCSEQSLLHRLPSCDSRSHHRLLWLGVC